MSGVMTGAPPAAAVPVPAPFLFNATVLQWHDGDTALLRVDRGDRDYSTWSVRLLGCATLELDEPGGPETQAELTRRRPPGSTVVLATVKPDKYGGRMLGRLYYRDGGRTTDLVEALIADGWAVSWNGRGRQPKPTWPRIVTGTTTRSS
jgi:endonuclease YncB( thermonuclease family)